MQVCLLSLLFMDYWDSFQTTCNHITDIKKMERETTVTELKLKLFCVLFSSDDIVLSIKSLLAETTMSIDSKTPNCLR